MPHRAAGSALRRGLGRGSARQHLQALWRARRQPQLDDCTRPPPQTHSTHTRAASRIAAAQHARARARSTPPPCGRRHLAHTPPARTARRPASARAASARPAGGRARCLSVNAPPDTPRECHLPPRAPQSAESLVRATCLFSFCLALMLCTFGGRGRRRAQRRSWRGARCGGPRVACRARLGRCGHRWRLEEDAPPGHRWVELANSAEAVEGLWF